MSIGMPVWNSERFIESALKSLLSQDFTDFHVTISDDGSTDRTSEICNEYARRDSRISYSRNTTNIGMVENFNRTFRLSSGKYFMWASDHDLWAPTFISQCVGQLERHRDAVLCVCPVDIIDTEGRSVGHYEHVFDTRHLDVVGRLHVTLWRLRWHVGSGAAIYGLIRSEALRRTRMQRNVNGPDWVLLVELCVPGAFVEAPDTLFSLRTQHPPHRTLRQQWETLDPVNRTKKSYSAFRSLTIGIVKALMQSTAKPLSKPFLIVDAVYTVVRRFGAFEVLGVHKGKQIGSVRVQ